MAKLTAVAEELRRRRHQTIREQGQWLGAVLKGTMPTSQCRQTLARCAPCGTTSKFDGAWRSGDGASASGWAGAVWSGSPIAIFRSRGSCIRSRNNASSPSTRGRSRMREFRTYGSVRGAASNGRPYRDPSDIAASVRGSEGCFASLRLAEFATNFAVVRRLWLGCRTKPRSDVDVVPASHVRGLDLLIGHSVGSGQFSMPSSQASAVAAASRSGVQQGTSCGERRSRACRSIRSTPLRLSGSTGAICNQRSKSSGVVNNLPNGDCSPIFAVVESRCAVSR